MSPEIPRSSLSKHAQESLRIRAITDELRIDCGKIFYENEDKIERKKYKKTFFGEKPFSHNPLKLQNIKDYGLYQWIRVPLRVEREENPIFVTVSVFGFGIPDSYATFLFQNSEHLNPNEMLALSGDRAIIVDWSGLGYKRDATGKDIKQFAQLIKFARESLSEQEKSKSAKKI